MNTLLPQPLADALRGLPAALERIGVVPVSCRGPEAFGDFAVVFQGRGKVFTLARDRGQFVLSGRPRQELEAAGLWRTFPGPRELEPVVVAWLSGNHSGRRVRRSLTRALGRCSLRSRKLDYLVVLTAIGCYLAAACALVQVAATHTLPFTFCTEPGAANAQAARCLAPQLLGYLFWLLIVAGLILTVVAFLQSAVSAFRGAAA